MKHKNYCKNDPEYAWLKLEIMSKSAADTSYHTVRDIPVKTAADRSRVRLLSLERRPLCRRVAGGCIFLFLVTELARVSHN